MKMNGLTYPLLSQLSRSLVLAVSQQFDNTSLIWCETGDFLDDFTDEGCALGEVTFSAGDAWLALDEFRFLSDRNVSMMVVHVY